MSERFVVRGDATVFDTETGLLWQRGASRDRVVWEDGFKVVEEMNGKLFGGFGDWRMPTQEELLGLMTPEENQATGLHLPPVFSAERCFWSSTEDHHDHHRAVFVDFFYGEAYFYEKNYVQHFIRAVRKPQ